MPRNSRKGLQYRRLQFMKFLEGASRTQSEIMEHLGISARQLQEDIKYFKENHPSAFIKESVCGDGRTERASYRWNGVSPWVFDQALSWISDRECVALSAAVQFFKNNTDSAQHTEDNESLGHVLEGLVQRMGIPEDAVPVSPIIEISRFGIEKVNHHVLQVCIHAVSSNMCLKFHYCNLWEEEHQEQGYERHVIPLRIQLIQSEWYLIAWRYRENSENSDGIVTYKVARMRDACRVATRPQHAPGHIEGRHSKRTHDNVFFATGGNAEQHVSIRFHKRILAHLRNRIWGRKTLITMEADDLDADWCRLSFYTTGIGQCQYWVLGFADSMCVEKPASLGTWVAERHRAAAEMYAASL